MHSLRNSISKRLYTRRLHSRRAARDWQGQYWQEDDGYQVIRCRDCRKFDSRKGECSIGFGSPVRKCISAAQEANLNSLTGQDLLEIGFGKHSIPRRLVTTAGGTWTGIEPMLPRELKAEFGKGGFGHVAAIPFDDESFDIVVGIQTLEHWDEPLPDPDLEIGYEVALGEIHRVLRPGGTIYFDAPVHQHGHEMFICGDLARIRSMFETPLWSGLRIQKWRQDYEPLPRYPAPEKEYRKWETCVTSYPDEQLERIRETGTVWLVTISASKA